MTPVIPRLIDMHCHLDLYPDHEALISECDRLQIATLAVTTTPKAWKRNLELAKNSSHVRVALGLHPLALGDLGLAFLQPSFLTLRPCEASLQRRCG